MTTLNEAMDVIHVRLRDVGSENPSGDEWLCPVHELDGRSHSPSLTVKRGTKDGQIVMHCAKCEDTRQVLDKLGLTFADLSYNAEPAKPVGNPVFLDYPDAEGRKHLRVRRQQMSDGSRRITQQHWNGRKWEGGVGDRERVLYRLPELLKACGKGRTIHLTEGESDANALNDWFKANKVKAFATTHPQGAKSWHLGDYAPSLAGAGLLVVWADRDADGYTGALQRVSALQKAGHTVELRLPIPVFPKADVRDHLEAGHSPADGKVVMVEEVSELLAAANEEKGSAAADEREARIAEKAATRLLDLEANDRAQTLWRTARIEKLHAQSKHARSMKGAEFFLDLPPDRPVLWGDGSRILWIDGEPLMICGDDGTGKSTIDHQLIAARLGFRDNFLGYPVQEATGSILYLAMDRPEQARRAGNRLFPGVVDVDFRSTLEARLRVWRGPLPIDLLSSPSALADWVQAEFGHVAEIHADSLKDLASRLSDDAVGSGVNQAIQEVVSRGINWVGLHHQRKASGDNPKPDQLSDVYGSRWLTAGQGSVLMLSRASASDKDQVELAQLKEPADRVPRMLLQHHRTSGRTVVVEAAKSVIEALDQIGDWATLNDIAAVMFGKPKADLTLAERKQVERALFREVQADEVEKRAATKGGSGGSTAATYRLTEES